jgi:hypothetical protein
MEGMKTSKCFLAIFPNMVHDEEDEQKATRRSQIIVRGCSVPNPKPFVNVHIGNWY